MNECGLDDAHYKLKIVENSLSCSLRPCLLTISYKDKSQAFELLSRMDKKKIFHSNKRIYEQILDADQKVNANFK